jgi:16S rRNA processing protein RimM
VETLMAKDVLLAAVIGAHGLKGEVRLKTFTEAPETLARYERLHARDGRVFTLLRIKPAKESEAVAAFGEVVDRATAEGLKGLEFFVARDVLPAPQENEFYHTDLIGLVAMDAADREIGRIAAVHNYGAGDVIEIARGEGDTVMLPFAKDFVPVVDLAAGRVVVAVPEDLEEERHVE